MTDRITIHNNKKTAKSAKPIPSVWAGWQANQNYTTRRNSNETNDCVEDDDITSISPYAVRDARGWIFISPQNRRRIEGSPGDSTVATDERETQCDVEIEASNVDTAEVDALQAQILNKPKSTVKSLGSTLTCSVCSPVLGQTPFDVTKPIPTNMYVCLECRRNAAKMSRSLARTRMGTRTPERSRSTSRTSVRSEAGSQTFFSRHSSVRDDDSTESRTPLKGRVVKVLEFGAYIDIGDCKDFFCHVSNLRPSRGEWIDDAREVIFRDDIIEVVRIIDRRGRPALKRVSSYIGKFEKPRSRISLSRTSSRYGARSSRASSRASSKASSRTTSRAMSRATSPARSQREVTPRSQGIMSVTGTTLTLEGSQESLYLSETGKGETKMGGTPKITDKTKSLNVPENAIGMTGTTEKPKKNIDKWQTVGKKKSSKRRRRRR
eukprot:1335923-Amorphochlora_amoeboformis.AAC.1